MLKDLNIPKSYTYTSKDEFDPFRFHLECLMNSKSLDLLLGYFSSGAIRLLSIGFASFIHRNGKIRLAINIILSKNDRDVFEKGLEKNLPIDLIDVTNLKELKAKFSEYNTHFFECLAWLISNNRIEFVIITPKEGNGISHYKEGVYSDGVDKIAFSGSQNFTAYGLTENLESLECFPSWIEGNDDRVSEKAKRISATIEGKRQDVLNYLSIEEIKTEITSNFGDKEMDELLVNEKKLLTKVEKISGLPIYQELDEKLDEQIEELESAPRFPFKEGPRDYQMQAYENWVGNDYKGLFAMATGTGKTLTSLNCILQEYRINNFYKFLILVPTTALAKQWVEEASIKFNYQNIVLCCSENSRWEDDLFQVGKSLVFGRSTNYGIITTYATFKGNKFQNMLKEYFNNDFDIITLVADEAHNFGSAGFLKVIPNFISRRIGLSATPERQFDEIGNKTLNEYFSCSDDVYTFEYNMKTAIENGILCRYYYHPIIVNLELEEQERYLKISKELVKYIDPETGKYRESDYVNNLLIKRKNIIHKASNKLNSLLLVVNEIGRENFTKAFIYVPEGVEIDALKDDRISDDEENETSKLIDNYITELYNHFQLKMAKFTGETKNRDQILTQFKEGKLDALLAMKCLDEGVDVPQTKFAIFCSSTGNPRQYIQRRGRVLRMHKDKQFAIIYDLIVKPTIDHTNTDESLLRMEKNIFLSELRRLVNFAVLSENKDESLKGLESLCYDLDIDIYELANNELNNYK
ncbi:DEAD/DEAH box helicase family protein [Sphingobacterium lactis]|uniref:Superfamily II DNA or RNA helicase n=1 Tax=Sphingobacterium lactis TaxID=797291 RepID=A0A1H5TYE7_9SPHI|nr:DEAD/DEAH box helicase family protein [Sphingobacterium lactis]SEF67047.1 Superfamily II DNA or RNA helicase [Sphingobacterium lactis]